MLRFLLLAGIAFFWPCPSKTNNKSASGLIHNRPGPVRCSECLKLFRDLAEEEENHQDLQVEREKEVGNKPIVFSLDRTQNRTSRANRRVLTGWRTEPLAKAVGLRKKKKLL
jgi:hypothetical protein